MRVLFYNNEIILQPETEFEASFIKGKKFKTSTKYAHKKIELLPFIDNSTKEYEVIGLTENSDES